ncbi:MAG: hypothetical protein KKC11_02605, partial [Candidatus Omnitrophica bacterium]|nr:hypothetical protein [Candidatus Omnitrophota bacterium]
MKDRFGIHRYHQWSLLWEELNDAFRYLLGQDDWERDGKLDIKDKRTKEAFEKLRGKLDGYLTRIYNGEEEINEEEFLRLMRAIIMSVESIQKRPRTKHRLKHYQLFWMPFWKFVISRTLRRKVLAKDNPFKEHLTDWNRKFNVSVVFIFTFVFMSYLFVKAFINLGLVGIPYFLAFHPVVFLIPFILVCVQAIFLLLRGQAIKKANPEGVVRKHVIQLVIQAIALAVGFVLVLMLPPTIIVMVPEVVRIVLKLILCAIVFETLRLTFYSVHYARKAIISRRFYKENNIYSVVKYDELPEALDRLFSDEGNGWYYDTSKKITMGQERIEIFRQAILRELSSVEDYQLLIGERDFNKWEKLLEIYENKGRDINKLKELLNRGDETTVKERIHRIIHWANDQVRMDKPSPPRTLRDLLAYNLSEQGFEEDAYFNEKNLNEDGLNNSDNPDPENQKTQTTRLSMLARDKPAYWKALIARLSEGVVVDGERVCLTSDEEEKMKDLAKNPLQKLEINPLLMSYIIPWANTHLGNLWNTGVSSLKVKRRFEYTVKAIMPNYSEEQVKLHVEDKTDRNMIKHSGSLCPIEEAFEKLSDEERGGPQIKTFREYLYYYVPGRRQQYLRGEISEKELLAEANQMAGLIESKYDINDKKKAPYYSAIKPLIVAMFMKGLTATWNRVPQGEQVHLFKWNSLTASLPYVHSLTLDLIDADHHSRTEDIWSLPEVASEYLYNPRVGAAIPIVDHYLAKGLGVVGKIIPPGENAFYYHAQTGKELMGGLTAYGKFSGRTKAWRWSEGLSGDDYVAEDSLTVVRFRSFGYICIRTSYYRRGKNWMYQSLNHKPPCFKWASDSGESVRGRIPLKLLLSDMVESTYIIDNFWWDGFGFFIKKPHLPRYLKWVVTCFLIFSWNLFAGISFLFWIMGTLFSQTVSYGSWFNSAYEDHHGLLKGFFLTFKDIFLRNFWYYVHWIFNYEEAAGIFGPEGLVRFISTGGKGAWIIRETRWQYIYLRDEHAIRTGVFWTVILLAFAPSSPWLMLIWFFPVFSFVAAWMGIYLLNPRLKKMDHLDNIKQIFFSGFWGFLDALNHLNAKVSLLFFWEKRVSHRQIGLLDAAVSQVFGAVDKRPDKGDLGPLYMLGVYNQYVSHYRRLFGTVSIVAMNEALRKVKEKGDLKEIQYALCQENRNFHPTAQLPASFAEALIARIESVREYIDLLRSVGLLPYELARNYFSNLALWRERLGNTAMRKMISYKEYEQMDWFVTEYEYLPHLVAPYSGLGSHILSRIAWHVPFADMMIGLYDTLKHNSNYASFTPFTRGYKPWFGTLMMFYSTWFSWFKWVKKFYKDRNKKEQLKNIYREKKKQLDEFLRFKEKSVMKLLAAILTFLKVVVVIPIKIIFIVALWTAILVTATTFFIIGGVAGIPVRIIYLVFNIFRRSPVTKDGKHILVKLADEYAEDLRGGNVSEAQLDVYFKALDGKDEGVCLADIEALGKLDYTTQPQKKAEVINKLSSLTNDKSKDVYDAIIKTLTVLDATKLIQLANAYINAFGSNNEEVRSVAAKALGELDYTTQPQKKAEVINKLSFLANDKSKDVYDAIIKTLITLQATVIQLADVHLNALEKAVGEQLSTQQEQLEEQPRSFWRRASLGISHMFTRHTNLFLIIGLLPFIIGCSAKGLISVFTPLVIIFVVIVAIIVIGLFLKKYLDSEINNKHLIKVKPEILFVNADHDRFYTLNLNTNIFIVSLVIVSLLFDSSAFAQEKELESFRSIFTGITGTEILEIFWIGFSLIMIPLAVIIKFCDWLGDQRHYLYPRVRLTIIKLLNKRGSRKTIKSVIKIYEDTWSKKTQKAAIETLGEISKRGDKRVIMFL